MKTLIINIVHKILDRFVFFENFCLFSENYETVLMLNFNLTVSYFFCIRFLIE